MGIAATREIALGEAYVYVPTKCIVNESKFRADPQVGHLLDKHPELFSEGEHAPHLVLIFFLIHEMSKGENSYWYHYLQTSALPDMPTQWSVQDLNELHDPIMK